MATDQNTLPVSNPADELRAGTGFGGMVIGSETAPYHAQAQAQWNAQQAARVAQLPPLAQGWEMKWDAIAQRYYFIDHVSSVHLHSSPLTHPLHRTRKPLLTSILGRGIIPSFILLNL